MNHKNYGKTSRVFTLLFILLAGCSSGDEGPTLADIPHYPNSTQNDAMTQSSPGSLLSGSLIQLNTTDPYDDVLGFYTTALGQYETDVMTHVIGDGRQTAISIPQKDGVITVAIQEFRDEGSVNITLMRVGM